MESDPARAYERRKAELSSRNTALSARERSLSALRGVTFLAAAGLGIMGGVRESVPLGVAASVTFSVFLAAVVAHAILITKKAEIELRIALVDRGLARIADAYETSPERGDRFAPELHPYAKDLDLFGQRSLFQLLVTAETAAGQGALAEWLLAGASAKTVAERQAAVRELAARPDLREDLAVLAREARAKMRPDVLFAWGEAKSPFDGDASIRVALLARYLAPFTVTLAILSFTIGQDLGLARHLWLVTLALQLVAVLRTGVATERSLATASSREEPLGRYAPVFDRIERTTFESALLGRVRAALSPGDAASPRSSDAGPTDPAPPAKSASAAMGRLQTILSFADLRHAGIFHLLLHLFTLWDLWCAVALERWRARHGRQIRHWIEALSTLEALSSLATFAHEHPDYVFPDVQEGAPRFAADQLAHPLLPRARRVANSVAFGEGREKALLITGSNMSGKSTLLRAIGTNAVLALAGAPVCASRLAMTVLDVRTSMRITDSLEQGVSHFYAELARLKEITTASDAGSPVLFLLDEILHGTNSRERQIGAKAVVKHLLAKRAIGAVSSHDLGLAALQDETSGVVRNVHFEEHVEGESMAFDYKLKPGVVTTTNALRLMRVIGLPIGDDD